MNKPKVVVIGGGFAGINVVQALKKTPVEITLVDRTNHHVFQPLLYQVATAALSIGDIAAPIREILAKQANASVLMTEVTAIDKTNQKIYLSDGDALTFDYLIVAPGARHSYFGHAEWEAHAPGLKTIQDALLVRAELLSAFERAERCEDPVLAQQYLNFVIVGGGPTGVEMAGSIAEFTCHTLAKNFRRINPEKTKITLVEGTSQLLPGFPPKLADRAKKDLEEIGVHVLLNTFVTDVQKEGVRVGNDFICTPNVIWAAGNQASPLLKTLDTPLDKQGRAIVKEDLTIPEYAHIFVLGDAASFTGPNGKPLPAIAPVAIQEARYVAGIIKDRVGGKKSKKSAFKYFDKGTIATIGKGKAVAMLGKLQFSGYLAWLIWGFIHILYLVSFRHRILVMTQWILMYFSGRRQSRVLIE